MAFIEGTEGADALTGSDAEIDSIHGLGGDDVLDGRGEWDELFGGAGDDLLYGRTGDDHLYGGEGNDILWGGGGMDTLTGGEGDDVLRGGSGDDLYADLQPGDTIIESDTGGYDSVFVRSWSVRLHANVESLFLVSEDGTYVSGHGNALDNYISLDSNGSGAAYGLAGDDTVFTNWGGVSLYGGAGNDFVGSRGSSELYGGSGNDHVSLGGDGDVGSGGGGDDSFELSYFDPEDVGTGDRQITDFDARFEDVVISDLTGALTSVGGGRLATRYFFAADGAAATAQTENHHYIFDRSSGQLYYDADGTGAEAQFQIAVINVVNGEFGARNLLLSDFG
jgi:Ca2+-binding RTX toxin-like protein